MCDMCRGIGNDDYHKWCRERLADGCTPVSYIEWLTGKTNYELAKEHREKMKGRGVL